MAINIDAKIKFVRGNSFTREFQLKNVDLNYVESLNLICNELNICENMIADENEIFKFYLSSSKTSQMHDIHTTYNLDIVFVDGSKKTIFYKEQFIVLPNENGGCTNE